jgi:hypothetical protein
MRYNHKQSILRNARPSSKTKGLVRFGWSGKEGADIKREGLVKGAIFDNIHGNYIQCNYTCSMDNTHYRLLMGCNIALFYHSLVHQQLCHDVVLEPGHFLDPFTLSLRAFAAYLQYKALVVLYY